MPVPKPDGDGGAPLARSASDERLRLAVRAANVGLWDWDLRSNEVYYSPEWKRMIGCDDAEITDDFNEWRSRVHPEDLDQTLQKVQAYLERRRPDYQAEFRFRHKDGSYRWILAQGALLNDAQGKPSRFLGAHVDITRRRQAEEALRESEELHRVTLANISDTVVLADDEGRIRYVCPNVAVIFGYSPPEVMALGSIEKLLGPGLFDPVELGARTELPNLERQITTKDGAKRSLLVNVKHVAIRGGTVLYTCRDVSRRRQAEESLRESEQRYRAIVETAPYGIITMDEESRILSANPAAETILGYTAEEIVSRSLTMLMPERFRAQHRAGLTHHLQTGGKHLDWTGVELPGLHKSGAEVPLEISLGASRRDGERCFTGILRDISDRKRTEDMLRSLVKGTAAVGEEFFASLARELAAALEVRYAFVGEVLPEAPERVRSLAVWANGKQAENFEYALAGTPCENVVGQTLCFYPTDVQAAFPSDELLAQMGVVSYIGTPLFGSTGQPLGLVVVMHDLPVPESERARSILTVFAARAGAELERERTGRALRRSEELFRAVVEDQGEMIVRWKPDGTCTFVNPAYCHALGKSADELVGRSFSPSVAGERSEAIRERVSVLTPANPVAVHIQEGASPTGKMLWEEWTDRGLFDADGRLMELQSTGRDITERRRAELRIRQLNRVYAVLSNINETIVREGDPPRLFDAACRIAVERAVFAWRGSVWWMRRRARSRRSRTRAHRPRPSKS